MQAGIVGMGIMGRLLALGLHGAGWQVTLFDKDPAGSNCSFAAAGLLSPFSELDRGKALIAELGVESIDVHWPRILEQLQETVYFRRLGTVVLCHPGDQAEWQIFSQRIAKHSPGNAPFFNPLTRAALNQLEPTLSHQFEQAYYFPQEGQLDAQALMPALWNYFERHGLACHLNTEVVSLTPGLVRTKEGSHRFDMVFDCRGLGARDTFANLRPLRGELLWLHAPEVTLHRPIRLLHPRYGLYIAPRPGNVYLVGASEIEADDYSPISVRTTLELLTAAYSIHPGFSEARIIKTVTHCRPTLSHHLPCITYADGLIAVNGLYRHGYLIAPALVQEILTALKSNQSNPHSIHYPDLWEHVA